MLAALLFLFAAVSALGGLATMVQLGIQLYTVRGDGMSQENSPPKKELTISRAKLISMSAVFALSLVLSVLGIIFMPPKIPDESIKWMTSWGPVLPFDPSHEKLGINANGHLLLQRFGADYRIAGVAFHYFGTGDIKDSTGLQKSGLFDLEDRQINMYIFPDQKFTQEVVQAHLGATTYFLLVIPKSVRLDQFSTVRQAESLGAIALDGNGGPP